MTDWEIRQGDCLALMAAMPAASVDAIVTDPPYGLGFMGKAWDHGVPGESFWREALRVAKPGAHLLAFGGTRTYHRLACAIEDAGWEIRDSLMFMYGAGFPKGSRVNRDPRFCQCDAPARSDGSTGPELPPGVHIGTEADASDDGPRRGDGHRSTDGGQGSLAGCPLAGGFGGGPPLRGEAIGQVAPPSQECAPARSRSVEPEDGQDGERECIPSLAPRSGLPSSLDSEGHDSARSASEGRTRANTSRADTYGSDHHTQGRHQGFSCDEYSIGFPWCERCRKPKADGWNVALKPAYEPIILARKPLTGTVAANVLAHGTGALNIDGCRIGTTVETWPKSRSYGADESNCSWTTGSKGKKETQETPPVPPGRWPANVLLDEDAARMLDEQSGERTSGKMRAGTTRSTRPTRSVCYGAMPDTATLQDTPGDSGGASRFFYTAKASASERHYAGRNAHPTVKPVDLMRWLVRLVTPPRGLVLDPFCGSGSTGIAALGEGFRFLGMEIDPESAAHARKRIAGPLFAGTSDEASA